MSRIRPRVAHGGDLARAIARFGGARSEWIDLSTGINRAPYPAAASSSHALRALPDADLQNAAVAAARAAFGAAPATAIALAPGAQALIQIAPHAVAPGRVGRVAIVSPTYSEHAVRFRAAGWRVETVAEPENGADADAVVVVNPNNPDGRRWSPERLAALATSNRPLIVDESFCDVEPSLSLAPSADRPGLLILRSFGKFFGLAGLRLGAAIGSRDIVERIADRLGPWAVSGPALEVAAAAYADVDWAAATRDRLAADGARLRALATVPGWRSVGGVGLFETFETPDAADAQRGLAEARIWSRVFDDAPGRLRLGAPGDESEWARLAAALVSSRTAGP